MSSSFDCDPIKRLRFRTNMKNITININHEILCFDCEICYLRKIITLHCIYEEFVLSSETLQ